MLRIFIFILTMQAATAGAQEIGFGNAAENTDSPVEVAADSLAIDQNTGRAVFTGNVVIGQGEMRVSAQEVTVEYADEAQSRIKSFNATGNVALVVGEDAAEAGEAIYDVDSGIITLSGNVLMTQGVNILSGDQIVVDLKKGSARADGRVRTIFQPGSN